jgi:hypothetical protein
MSVKRTAGVLACALALSTLGACRMYITEVHTASPKADVPIKPVKGSVGLRMEDPVSGQFRIESVNGLDIYDVFHWNDTLTNAFIHGMEGKADRLQKHRGRWIIDVVRADLRFVRAEAEYSSAIVAKAAVDYELRLLDRELNEIAREQGEALSKSLASRGNMGQATVAAGEAAAAMFEEAVPKLFAAVPKAPAPDPADHPILNPQAQPETQPQPAAPVQPTGPGPQKLCCASGTGHEGNACEPTHEFAMTCGFRLQCTGPWYCEPGEGKRACRCLD